jgi:ubiquinone/menaquinone biosynthesis C-methylase UbiE
MIELAMPDETTASLTRFDELAETYEGWFTTRLGAFVARREKELILRLLQSGPGEVILEVGSGTGYFLREAARPGARCIGVEPSAEMLAVAMSRPLVNVDYVIGCGESLPFKDASCDGLLYMTTLEFVQDVDAALREATRVVRPGGRLVFGVLNADGPWARARKREGGLWADARFYGSAELGALLSPLGAVQIDYCVHVPPQLGWLPAPLMSLVDWLVRRLSPAGGALIGARVTKGRLQ